jgi:hypothetical protein
VVVVVVVAGLEAVVVVVAGLEAVVVLVVVAGLELVVGAFGAADGVWATAREAIANKVVVSDKVMGLMVWRLC